jgi:hypothetical protein
MKTADPMTVPSAIWGRCSAAAVEARDERADVERAQGEPRGRPDRAIGEPLGSPENQGDADDEQQEAGQHVKRSLASR